MKKLTLLLAALVLFTALAPISALAENEYCTVIFRTTDEFICFTDGRKSIWVDVKVGNKISLPQIYSSLYGCEYAFRLESTDETVDPTQLTATGESMYFEVYFPERPEVTHKITYICHDYPGIYFPGNDPYHYSSYDEISVSCPDGYVIQESDLPQKGAFPGAITDNLYFVWEPNPLGYEVYEDVTFTATVEDTGIYAVTFWDMGHQLLASCSAPRGSSVEPPTEVPDWGNYMFTGKWSNDHYLNVQHHLDVFAEYVLRGDANGNDELDVGDATLILRTVVHLAEPQAHYDYNKDGRINSGDAAAVLRAVVGK